VKAALVLHLFYPEVAVELIDRVAAIVGGQRTAGGSPLPEIGSLREPWPPGA